MNFHSLSLTCNLAVCGLLLITFADLSHAKFTHIYRGIATDGLNACLQDTKYNFTIESIQLRGNAGAGFACIMDQIGNSKQAILSSGASIVGLVPTALTLLGNRRSDIMRIHARLPILALFLTLTGVSVNHRIPWKHQSTPASSPLKPATGFAKLFNVDGNKSRGTLFGLLAVHALALIAATVVIWQTYDVSVRAVISWACWTSFYPAVWVGLGPITHIGKILTERIDRQKRPYLSFWLMIIFDAFEKVQFLAGTAILGSLALVSGQNGVKVIALYGGVAVVMKECAAWTLENL